MEPANLLRDFTSGQLELGRTFFNVLVLFAGVSVWIGVLLERETLPERIQVAGWRLLVIGLAFETVCAAFLWQIDTEMLSREGAELNQASASAGTATIRAQAALTNAGRANRVAAAAGAAADQAVSSARDARAGASETQHRLDAAKRDLASVAEAEARLRGRMRSCGSPSKL